MHLLLIRSHNHLHSLAWPEGRALKTASSLPCDMSDEQPRFGDFSRCPPSNGNKETRAVLTYYYLGCISAHFNHENLVRMSIFVRHNHSCQQLIFY